MRKALEARLMLVFWRIWHLNLVYGVFFSVIILSLVSELTLETGKDGSQSYGEQAVVLAKTRGEDVSWVYDLQPQWTPYIYTADHEPGYNQVPANKGREAMAYLTHIIDNYDNLANITVFMHGSSTQWHNDVGNQYSSYVLSNLRTPTVKKRGYTNLRCQHSPGCPIAVRPFDPAFTSRNNVVYQNFATIYTELFNVPITQVSIEIGSICCGQFALTRERIRQRPRDEYVHMRDWALSTPLNNFATGSVFEMLWHVVFRDDSVLCPDTQQCYYQLYGLCDLGGPE